MSHTFQGQRVAAALLSAICAVIVSCTTRDSGERVYRTAWSSYVSGNLNLVETDAAIGAARLQQKRNSKWYWSLRLLEAEAMLAQAKRTQAEALLLQPVPPGADLGQVEVRRLIDLASTGLQAPTQTADLFARARASARDEEVLIRLNLAQGSFLVNHGKAAEADALFRSALDIAVRINDVYQQGQTLSNLCSTARILGQYEESISYGLHSLEIAERIGARRTAAFAHGNLGSTYAWLGNFDAALENEQKAIEEFQKIGARSNLMVHLGELGVIYDRQDELRKAFENYQRAYTLARQLGSDRDAARHAANLALTSIKAGNWDEAESWNNQAGELAAKTHYEYAGLLVERNSARIAWGRGRAAEAATICRRILAAHPNEPFIRWESYYLLGLIDSAQRRFAQADASFETALKTISENRSRLSDSQNRITLLSSLIPLYQAFADTLVDQNDNAHALRVIESSRAQVLSERLGREVKEHQFASISSLEQTAAATHSAILSFWVAPSRSFAWLITPQQVERFQLPGEAEIQNLVTKYRETVEHSLRDPIAAGDPAGLALWHALLEKIAPRIPKGASLIVIPDGPLHRLNLETVIVPSPQPHYWIEDVQIAVSPSITIAASTPASAAPSAPALLVIGAPNYAGTSYEPLPNASTEIREIQSHFGGWKQTVVEGAKAAPAAYAQAGPANFSLIHFAAHAEANYERPLESSIILSQAGGHSKLLARDVTDIPIHASLVTISACRSAGTRAYAGEGLMGFAWAFLNAGARAVVAGLWDVSDSSTGQLMDRLYAGIAAGQEPATALRNAKLSLLHGAHSFQKPFYWAPFQVYLGSATK
jgi:CHAT domain-containing protein